MHRVIKLDRSTRSRLIFVDVEATFNKPTPYSGRMTHLGAVTYPDFNDNEFEFVFLRLAHEHELDLYDCAIKLICWLQKMVLGQPVFVSDNPAFDWQWVAHMFDMARRPNPFGHSARRISDYYAGLVGNFRDSQRWKKLRVTRHDHHAVHDARGNAEAFARIQHGER